MLVAECRNVGVLPYQCTPVLPDPVQLASVVQSLGHPSCPICRSGIEYQGPLLGPGISGHPSLSQLSSTNTCLAHSWKVISRVPTLLM